MSRRALRRLRGEQRGQEPLGPDALQFVFRDDDDAEEEGPKRGPGGRRPRDAAKEGVRVNNRFELIDVEDVEEGPVMNGERPDCLLADAVVSGSKRRSQSGSAATKKDGEVAEGPAPPEQVAEGPAPPEQVAEGPAPPEQVAEGPAPPEQVAEGPARPEQVAEGPAPPEQVAEGPAPPEQVAEGPARPEQVAEGPAPPEQVAEGPAHPEQVAEGPARPEQVAEGPARPEQVAEGPAPPEQVAEGPAPPEQVAEGPAPPEQVAEGPARPEQVAEGPAPPEQSNTSGKLRKKKKKQKNKKRTAEASENELEDIDRILERIEDDSGSHPTGPAPLSSKKHVLYVEHRHLNPDTELKRYFGARAVLGEQRPRQRQRVYPKCTWLTTPKSTWPRYTKPGLSMRLLESTKGLSCFAFEHSEEYQQTQLRFLSAVESMEPNNIVVLLQTSPYHVDSLLQLSDACRFQEDQEMARDLIERALYSMECAFHPLFSLTSGTCRLDYRRPENRSFYLALYKQMSFLEKRGCPRTALEYCKLILSLEPDEDPLCMLLLIDHLALRARNYEYLIRLFQEWEAHRNLSQLPNFAFSVPLAYFLLSQQADLPEQELNCAREKASLLLRQALTMFPGVLMPLLGYCSVRPDATVTSHHFFGPEAEISQPPALSQLVSLYLGRSHFLWKEPATISWLEETVHEVLKAVDAGDPEVEACESRRKVLYQRAPRNIHRHVILSEIKEAVAALPLDVSSQPVLGFDPLPPVDTIYSYVRPERLSPVSHGNTIALFFRSLLPNYTVEGERPEDGGAEGLDHNQGLNRLMLAVRDMMANFHFHDLEVPREEHPEGDGEWD